MNRDVVVTGIGTVAAHGVGTEELSESLAAGVAPTRAVREEAGDARRSRARTACRVNRERLAALLPPRLARRMSPASRHAVAAAREAVADAGLDVEEVAGPHTAVSLGTAYGTTEYTYRLLLEVRDAGPEYASPFLFMETVASAHAGQVALALQAHGPNYTISQREASGVLAVCRGAELVRSGRARRVIAGNVDEVTPYQHAVLDAWRALARATAPDGEERARVFDAQRNGFLCAEGGTVLLLEDAEAADARGAPLRARLPAWVRGFDPGAPATDWGTGAGRLAAAARRGLDRAGIAAESIARVASGASGSRRGDLLEARTLRALFGDGGVPPVLAPKAVTGEYGGAFLAAAVLACGPVHWARDAWFGDADPAVGLAPHGGPLAGDGRVLVSTLAAGGAAAWLVLDPA